MSLHRIFSYYFLFFACFVALRALSSQNVTDPIISSLENWRNWGTFIGLVVGGLVTAGIWHYTQNKIIARQNFLDAEKAKTTLQAQKSIQNNNLLIRQVSVINIGAYPGPFLFKYRSIKGEKIAPIGYMAFIEVTNIGEIMTRITSYELKLKIKNKWVKIPNLSVSNPLDVYYAVNVISKCINLDFRENSFDINAMNREIKKGESVRGWVFYEWPKELRNISTQPKTFSYTLTDKLQKESKVEGSFENGESPSSAIDGGFIIPYKKYIDLSGFEIFSRYELIESIQKKN
jgi:hypothetical protein